MIVLGGPAMLIGLGGGAASSMGSGQSDQELDFASVQRENPEMQRRCQEVIDACWALGERNPIISIHDVGAGGLSNALPELLDDSERGGRLELRRIPNADSAMSPMEIWCNEAQERYVLAVAPESLARFQALCERERCPFAVLGEATGVRDLDVSDRTARRGTGGTAVAGAARQTAAHAPRCGRTFPSRRTPLIRPAWPCRTRRSRCCNTRPLASKRFLITIGDRSVGGLVARDQMIGPWQVPVADAAVTLSGFRDFSGEAFAIGERTPLAIINAPASGRMAIAEAVTNLACAPVDGLSSVRLSANWMAAAGEPGQDADLFDTVHAVGMELCPELGIAIPVGKDSLSLKTFWNTADGEQQVVSPVSLVVTAFAPVTDARRVLTPLLDLQQPSALLLCDLGAGRDRLGGSILAQVQGGFGQESPDLDDPAALKAFFELVQSLNRDGLLLAYHDRSDGGLLATVCEMSFASRCGLELEIDLQGPALLARLFSEEAGAVLQVREQDLGAVMQRAADAGLGTMFSRLGRPASHHELRVSDGSGSTLALDLPALHAAWGEISHAVARLRDNPECADAERQRQGNWNQPDLAPELGFDPEQDVAAPMIATGVRPQVAILREQGVNGHVEMAAAFDLAGFEAVDVHMSDLATGRQRLDSFQGLVACGGFSYGDVLGAGRGWAKSILFNETLRSSFADFFADTSRFALGVCNGCQALSALRSIIPGAAHWPDFVRNESEQFEARLSLVRVEASPSLFLAGMAGSRLPVATAHGEGRVEFNGAGTGSPVVALRYVEPDGTPASTYPQNPNGSPGGITGLCNEDGRVTIMMPHPERTLRTVNFSWAPAGWGATSPWMRMFQNARLWVELMSEHERSHAPGGVADSLLAVDAVRLHGLVLRLRLARGAGAPGFRAVAAGTAGRFLLQHYCQPGPRLPVPGPDTYSVHLSRRHRGAARVHRQSAGLWLRPAAAVRPDDGNLATLVAQARRAPDRLPGDIRGAGLGRFLAVPENPGLQFRAGGCRGYC